MRKFKDAFDEIGNADQYEFLLEGLPAIYEDEIAAGMLTEDSVNAISQALSTHVKLLNTGYQIVKNKVAEAVSEMFGEKGDLVQCKTSVEAWYEELTPRQRQAMTYQDSPEAESLVRILGDSSINFETQLMDHLPKDFRFGESIGLAYSPH